MEETQVITQVAGESPELQADASPEVRIDPAVLANEPKFECCWADEDREICTVVLGTTTFRMRSLTAGEAQMIRGMVQTSLPKHEGGPTEQHKVLYARAIGKEQDEISEGDIDLLKKLLSGKVVGMDGSKIISLTVAASLGMWSKFGREGWSDPNWTEAPKITEEKLMRLKDDAVSFLWREHNKFFRTAGSAA
jgi:hypothetical protein